MEVKIYTLPTCPKCKILKGKLKEHGIEYKECQDTEEMQAHSIESVPVITVSNKDIKFTCGFSDAVKWINEQ